MGLVQKLTDFVRLEEGNIGQSSALMVGAVLSSAALASVLLSPESSEAGTHRNICVDHTDHLQHVSHIDYPEHLDGTGHTDVCNEHDDCMHEDYGDPHINFCC